MSRSEFRETWGLTRDTRPLAIANSVTVSPNLQCSSCKRGLMSPGKQMVCVQLRNRYSGEECELWICFQCAKFVLKLDKPQMDDLRTQYRRYYNKVHFGHLKRSIADTDYPHSAVVTRFLEIMEIQHVEIPRNVLLGVNAWLRQFGARFRVEFDTQPLILGIRSPCKN